MDFGNVMIQIQRPGTDAMNRAEWSMDMCAQEDPQRFTILVQSYVGMEGI